MSNNTKVIAHRGLRSKFPENTTQSINAAIGVENLHGIEFDVELADKPVVLHQETLIPSKDFKKLELATRNYTSRDWVSMHSAEEICALDAGSWLSEEFSNITVPELKEVLSLDWRQKHAFIELKDPTFWSEKNLDWPKKMVDSVVNAIKDFSKNSRVNVISFNPEILHEIAERPIKLELTLALWTEWEGKVQEAIHLAKKVGANTISLPYSMILCDDSWVNETHKNELLVSAYPVSPAKGEPGYKDYTASKQAQEWKTLSTLGVDIIVSDFAEETLKTLEEE